MLKGQKEEEKAAVGRRKKIKNIPITLKLNVYINL